MVELDQRNHVIFPAGVSDDFVAFDLFIIPEADMVRTEASVRRHGCRFHTEKAEAVFCALDIVFKMTVA